MNRVIHITLHSLCKPCDFIFQFGIIRKAA
ncbi:Uncharacterised protein [Vibrio cholerae]|nr:Uncharacterised protein [Vibrio cholerae]